MTARRAGALVLTWAVLAAVSVVPAAAPGSTAVTGPYAGTGTWVSIFAGDAVWDHPARHVRGMQARGVRTLYLQTASSTLPVGADLYRPSQLARFLHAAHERDMQVVAWYLPPLRRVAREHARVVAAIDFRTAGGHRFDGFALDVEPSATTPTGALRDDNLRRLSRRVRASAGADYPLGAIIPSARGFAAKPRYWPDFPYSTIGRFYDVVLPMSYHTYRVAGAAATYAYTADNVAALRSELGPTVAVHVIGGETGRSNRRETRAFVRACQDAQVLGASMWHYGSHGPEDWEELNAFSAAPAGAGAGS